MMINSFLLIGQSNMAGRGALHEVEPIAHPDILMFRSNSWRTAKEPLHTDRPDIAGVGLGMSFAESLHRRYYIPVGLIPCAYGGSALSEWRKGGALYANAVRSVAEARKSSRLKGVLWHQGESDADAPETAASYKENFMVFIQSLLTDLGDPVVPVVIGELGEFLPRHHKCAYAHIVNGQLAEIAGQGKPFTWASATGLTDKGDAMHFDARSLREFGKRYAFAWASSAVQMGVDLE